ncbi:hypothetical protein ACFFX0_27130 [Citricoccus parietis]|uniref:Uncharacterized protein n=1 Tax=Citricoccus parietis TaxID=592307 RepID=A0ABV5G6S5_9MICC
MTQQIVPASLAACRASLLPSQKRAEHWVSVKNTASACCGTSNVPPWIWWRSRAWRPQRWGTSPFAWASPSARSSAITPPRSTRSCPASRD